MFIKKGLAILIAVFVIISPKGCMGCFSEDKAPESILRNTGDSFFKACRCDKIGYSVQHLKWIDPSGAEVVGRRGPGTNLYTAIGTDARDLNIYINSISTTMNGIYKCETNFEGKQYTQTYNISVLDLNVSTNTTQHIVLGENSPIYCEVRNINVTMLWYIYRDDTMDEISSNEKYTIENKGLVVNNVTEDDGGTYVCIADHKISATAIEKNITVQVTIRPVISELKPTPGTVVIAGSRLTIECVAEGKPHPEYFWSKVVDLNGRPPIEQNITWYQELNQIVFESINKDDAGTYECISANIAGSDAGNVTIEVQVPPEITEFQNFTANEGNPLEIVCSATGEPKPLIRITTDHIGMDKDPSIIPDNKVTNDGSELHLHMTRVNRTYRGSYFCNASNKVGSDVKEMYFNVNYMPYFAEPVETLWGWNGKIVNMSCKHDSNPPSNITWSFRASETEDGTTADQVKTNQLILQLRYNSSENNLILPVNKDTIFGLYECHAENAYGRSTKRVHLKQAFRPAAIKNVTDINKTATSVTFYIEGPEEVDGPPVLAYVAQYDISNEYNVTHIHHNRTWSLDRKFIIERLKPNSTYFIKFAANNEAGVGIWTNISEFDTPETSVPEPPSLDYSQPGSLRWRSPEPNGHPIDHYIIEYCPFNNQVINQSLCKEETVTASEISLDHLDRSSTYSFKVRAHNSHGYSEFMEKIVTTPEYLIGVPVLSAEAVIGISAVVVLLCLLLLDLILLCWRRQGIIASCFIKKNKKDKQANLHARDKKGLLAKDGEARPDGSLTSPNNGHREFEYNKNTGVITGKHSSV